MGQTVRPFLEYLVLQFAVAIVGLNIVREKDLGMSACLKAWIFGQMLLFAVLQVLAVPMILLRWKFNILFYSFIGIGILLFGLGCMRLKQTRIRIEIKKETWNWLSLVLLIAALLLILLQSGIYFVGMHLDEDDARWLAEANDALEYGNMMTRNLDTGEYLGYIQVPKDAASPWPMMIAVFSRILGTGSAIFSHSVYAPIELLLMYAVYWLMAEELFEKRESRLTFLFFVALLNLFMGRTVYTQSTFSLVRIWQGKATVAGVIIPLLLYLFLRINKENKTTTDWLLLPIACCAACLMSGMGISIAAIMIGAYSSYHIIAYKNWKRIPLAFFSILPSIIFLVVYTSYQALV